MRLAPIVTGLLLLAPAAAPGDAAAAGRRCRVPQAAQVLAKGSGTVVYEVTRRIGEGLTAGKVWGCTAGARRMLLSETDEDSVYLASRTVVRASVNRRRAGLVVRGHNGRGCVSFGATAYDLERRRPVTEVGLGSTDCAESLDAIAIRRLVVSRDGALGMTRSIRGENQVLTAASRTLEIVDAGAGIDLDSMRLKRRRLHWLHAGEARSVALF